MCSLKFREGANSSPVEYVKGLQRVLTYLGLFELHGVSNWFKTVHRIFIIGCQVLFLYMGCVLQLLSLLNVTSAAEIPISLTVGVCYINIATKAAVFASKRRDIEKLWNRFEDDDFKVQHLNELRCAHINLTIRKFNKVFIIFCGFLPVFFILPG